MDRPFTIAIDGKRTATYCSSWRKLRDFDYVAVEDAVRAGKTISEAAAIAGTTYADLLERLDPLEHAALVDIRDGLRIMDRFKDERPVKHVRHLERLVRQLNEAWG